MKALSFEGSGLEYFKIWIVNILLTIVTLGLYYPWAKVRNHRYFYGNSTLEGRNFEYHATGKQLFIGYLISISLVIIYVIIQNISPIGAFIALGVLFFALPWIVWRSMMFNMRMISFSNVRFSFDGKLGQAYINFLLLPFLLLVAIYGPIIGAAFSSILIATSSAFVGILTALLFIACYIFAFYAYAWMKKRNTTYAINGARYGQGRFATTVETKGFAKILLKTIGVSILVTIAAIAIIMAISAMTVGISNISNVFESLEDPEAMQEIMSGGLALAFGLFYLIMIIASFVVLAYSFVRNRAYTYANSTLDNDITFASTLSVKSVTWVMLSNLLLIIISLGFAMPWAKVRMAKLVLENTQADTQLNLDTYVSQQQGKQSALGEQIGEAFDVDVQVAF